MLENISFPFLILLADDDVADRLLFKDALEQINKNISVALTENGDQLIRYLSNENNPLPDLVFIDLNMPYQNGLVCLEIIRNNDRLKNLFVIIYSACTQLESIEKALDKGASLYFAKSCTFQDLINRLKKVLLMNHSEFDPGLSREKFLLTDEVGL